MLYGESSQFSCRKDKVYSTYQVFNFKLLREKSLCMYARQIGLLPKNGEIETDFLKKYFSYFLHLNYELTHLNFQNEFYSQNCLL